MVDRWSLLNQGVLFAHLIAFAVALSAVLREDLRLLRTRRVELPRLARTARTVSAALAVLWVTGLALVAFSIAAGPLPWQPSAKLEAKFVVVSVLTLNGGALHAIAFPRLARNGAVIDRRLWLPAVLGAVSSASWLVASFIGAARLVSAWLSFTGFMLLYGVAIGASLALALFALRARPAAAALDGWAAGHPPS
jgi:hypothetical protein